MSDTRLAARVAAGDAEHVVAQLGPRHAVCADAVGSLTPVGLAQEPGGILPMADHVAGLEQPERTLGIAPRGGRDNAVQLAHATEHVGRRRLELGDSPRRQQGHIAGQISRDGIFAILVEIPGHGAQVAHQAARVRRQVEAVGLGKHAAQVLGRLVAAERGERAAGRLRLMFERPDIGQHLLVALDRPELKHLAFQSAEGTLGDEPVGDAGRCRRLVGHPGDESPQLVHVLEQGRFAPARERDGEPRGAGALGHAADRDIAVVRARAHPAAERHQALLVGDRRHHAAGTGVRFGIEAVNLDLVPNHVLGRLGVGEVASVQPVERLVARAQQVVDCRLRRSRIASDHRRAVDP